ncbi:Late embryogenesis abundant hydroxyproline-rich glycoprotein family, putative [Theobroma cacao]|uniref:Late embryogenesis abundant hydroxyproline-rich glycoprotein family, putative n=1 Tax=Theobroma cacao TaxID=3641 RepID=A0A061GB77_THECC|nr:Late embryogenesis abundant hydroxyproline-rich glycoprotein family, putative [Theobroma cacao]
MTDRVYPSSKPAANGGAAPATTANPSFPATKAQLYGASRPLYRPQANRHRYRRSCCCSCCLWTSVAILLLILLAAIAGAILYVLYRPHRPTFTVSSLKISTLNITSGSKLITNINLNVTAKNPNKKLVYTYDPITISLITNDDIDIGDGSFGSFVHGTKNTTLLKAAITSNQELDDTSAGKLKTALNSKNGLQLKIKLVTKVKAKMGALKTPKLGIRVICEGIKATAPKGKSATTASTSDAKCKVDLRIKIWKWTF